MVLVSLVSLLLLVEVMLIDLLLVRAGIDKLWRTVRNGIESVVLILIKRSKFGREHPL